MSFFCFFDIWHPSRFFQVLKVGGWSFSHPAHMDFSYSRGISMFEKVPSLGGSIRARGFPDVGTGRLNAREAGIVAADFSRFPTRIGPLQGHPGSGNKKIQKVTPGSGVRKNHTSYYCYRILIGFSHVPPFNCKDGWAGAHLVRIDRTFLRYLHDGFGSFNTVDGRNPAPPGMYKIL